MLNIANCLNPEQPLVRFRWLGSQPYEATWQAMRKFTDERHESTPDEIWFLEHPPVYTLGQNGNPSDLLVNSNIPLVRTDRGGQITYHGPGQLMIYTLVDLKRKKFFVRDMVCKLEQSIIAFLEDQDIHAQARRDAPGVYIQDEKICSIGLRIRRGCAYHGIAFNVNMDLNPFSWINPCGFTSLKMTQLAHFNKHITPYAVAQNLINYLTKIFVYTHHTWAIAAPNFCLLRD